MSTQSFEDFEKFVKEYQEKQGSFEDFEGFVQDRLKKRETKPAKISPFGIAGETLKTTGKDIAKGFEFAGKETLKTLGGVSEAIKAVPTGVLGFFTGWGSTLGALAMGKPWSEAKEAGEKITQKISYQPKGEAGKTISQVPFAPFSLAFQGLDEVAKKMAQGEPETEAMLSIAFQTGAIMLAPTLKGPKAQYYKQAIKQAATTPVRLKIFKKMAKEAKPSPEIKVAVNEFITQAEKVTNLLKEEIPKKPGLELRKIWEREKLATPEELGIKKKIPTKIPTLEEQIKTFEKAGKVEVLPGAEKMEATGREYWLGRGLPREFLYKGAKGKAWQAPPLEWGGITGRIQKQYIGGQRIDTLGSGQTAINAAKKAAIELQKDPAFKDYMRRVSHGELSEKAKLEHMTVENMLGKKFKAVSAVEQEAIKQIVWSLEKDMFQKGRLWRQNPGDMHLKALYFEAIDRWRGSIAAYRSVGTEAARQMVFRQRPPLEAGELEWKYMKKIRKYLEDTEMTDEIASRLATLDPSDPLAVHQFLKEVRKAKFSDQIFEVWMNGLLSGPQTHIVNMSSMILNMIEKPTVTLGAALLEAPKRLIGKKPEVYFGEAKAELVGILNGFSQATERASYAAKWEMPLGAVTKLDVKIARQTIKGKKGEIIRGPTRGLIIEDEFFKGLIYSSEIHRLAYKDAIKNKIPRKKIPQRMAEFINNPPKAAREAANQEAIHRAFQDPLGKWGQSLQSLRDNMIFARWIAPFLKVSINIPKYALKRTPLNIPRIIYKASRKQFKPGELPREIIQTAMGSAMSIGIFNHVLGERITGGGPVNKAQRDLWYRQGNQPYSLRIGNKWFSYQRIEPLGTIFGLAADMGEIWDQISQGDRERLAERFVNVFTQNIENKTFMRGVSDALNALVDPERNLTRWAARFAGSGVPTGVAHIARTIDPVVRDVRDTNLLRYMINEAKSRLPWLSKQLPARRDIYGRPLTREGGTAARMLSPMWQSEIKKDFVDKELSRLGMGIGRPGRKIQIGRVKGKRKYIKLSPQAYEKLLVRGGGLLHHILIGLMLSYEYRTLNDEDKIKKIESAVRNVRRGINEPIRALYQPRGVR